MAIIVTLLGLGLRLSELVELDIGNVNFDDSTIKVTATSFYLNQKKS